MAVMQAVRFWAMNGDARSRPTFNDLDVYMLSIRSRRRGASVGAYLRQNGYAQPPREAQ